MPATLPYRPRPPLRVAVLLSAPWAFADDLCLDGVEVREARRYAQWRRRELEWTSMGAQDLPRALSQGRVDLAIGGLRATPALVAMARLARFSDQRLGAEDCPLSRGFRHVWAVSQDAWREWAAVKAYLQLVRHRPALARKPAAPTGAPGVQQARDSLLNGSH